MAWTVPRDWVADEVITAVIMNSAVRDNLRYLKGLDGDITFEDDIVTAHNVDGVDVSGHESRHVSGGADEIDSTLAIAAMANLTQNKVWKGNVSNRPAEVDFPTKTLSAANETVQAGYYAATTLSAVDADLAVGNIKSGVTIFGFLGTYVLTPTTVEASYLNFTAYRNLTAAWVAKVTIEIPATAVKVIVALGAYRYAGHLSYYRFLYNNVERIAQSTQDDFTRWNGAGVGSAADAVIQCKEFDTGTNDELYLGHVFNYLTLA